MTNVGTPPTGTITQLNGLGIGSGGGPIFAYNRTGNRTANMFQFDPTAERWIDLSKSFDTTPIANGGFNGALIGGAVDLSSASGQYYFGGFISGGTQFKIWRYNPGPGTFQYVGYVDTTTGAATSSNGDMAFDSRGNLYIVRGVGTTTTIFSVTNDALAVANGGRINSSGSNGVTTVSGINGLAFDSAGKAYLGGGNTVTSFDMPNFTNSRTVTTGLAGTTDLASCSSPATITVEKDVKNRVNPGDQFALRLDQGTANLGTATTTGTDNGIQSQMIGPLPAIRGTTFRFSESAAGTTDLSKYASSYQCFADGNPISGASGTGTAGSITIPSTGNEIVCRIINSPLTANVTINKKTQNAQGGNEQNASGWTVGATTTATSGTATQAPTATTQTTDADGNAKWTISFGSLSARANLAVREVQQSGFAFQSGSCRITRLDGSTATVTLTGAGSQTLSSAIQPGDQVTCGYINRQQAASVTVNKTWNIDGRQFANGSQPDGISAKLQLDPAGQPSGDPTFGQTRTGFAVGDSVRIGETTTIDAQQFPGCTVKSRTISGPGITGTVPLTDNFSTRLPGAANTYSVTNTVECQSLTIVKDVTNDDGGTLAPADWDQRLFATPNGGTRLAFDSGERKYVPTGSFVISEDTLVGYDQESISCTGATYNDATKTVSIAAGQNATCTVKNNDSAGTVAWKKANESGDLLAGSEWTLRGPDGTEVDITDCVAGSADACSGPDKDPEAGEFLIKDLEWGDYTVVETRAPAGYVVDETERNFTISRERLDFQFGSPFVNKQADSPQLPLTGGTGTIGYVIGGVVLLLGCVAGAIWHNRRRALERS